ncbi:FK506 binding protein proline rotamase rapamycin-binding protein [Actinomortierella ambigua]|nr:FK506 binding protein proline rotamase rapamycin-binding protein [Actinomortierella ambigua]
MSTKEILKSGDGVNFPKIGQKIAMHYTGTLENGQKFDSSRDRGEAFTANIGVGRLIAGWDKLVPQMSLGEHAKLTIPASEGYGPRGIPGVIPGGATLIFDVELLELL